MKQKLKIYLLSSVTAFYHVAHSNEAVSNVNVADTAPVVREVAAASNVGLDDVINKSLKSIVEKTAATKGRVAIMDFPSLESKGLTNLSSYIANKAGNQMINGGRQVVDRGALERIINEQKLQQNSLMDAATAAKVGKLAGAGVFIVGNYSILSKKFILTVRALSVETGQFIAASEETVAMNPDLKMELDELSIAAGTTVGSTSLATTEESQESTTSVADEEMAKNQLAFDKEVCRIIKKRINASLILGTAVKYGIIDMPDEDLNVTSCDDSMGETGDNCYDAGSWVVSGDSGFMRKSDIARGVKGKSGGGWPFIERWMYRGSNRFKELESCSPEIGLWTESRGAVRKKKN